VWVFLAATLGTCALVVLWAIGLDPDVGGLVALATLGVGILIQMADRARSDAEH
jgi:hypothetical protein